MYLLNASYQNSQNGFDMPSGVGSMGSLPGIAGTGMMAGIGGLSSDGGPAGGMFGLFQSMLMTMMSSLMATMSSGMVGQVMAPGQQGALVSGQRPSFGSGGPGLSNGAQHFLGGQSSKPRAPGGSRRGGSAAGRAVKNAGSATGKIVSRSGGQMDASIAKNFDAMVAAAKKDGVSLQISSGYRSRAEQEKLYAAYKNGTGNLAAKPGTSNHEKGQAIDFKNTSGAYSWLAKNAQRYGFKNLPGEPWHYSTNGR